MPGWRNGRRNGLPAGGRSASGGKISVEDEIREEMAAYVLLGGNGQYMYKGSAHICLGGGMADATDFLPVAGPPLAEKSL